MRLKWLGICTLFCTLFWGITTSSVFGQSAWKTQESAVLVAEKSSDVKAADVAASWDEPLLLDNYPMDLSNLDNERVGSQQVVVLRQAEDPPPRTLYAAVGKVGEGLTDLVRCVLRWGPLDWVCCRMSENPAVTVVVLKLGILFLYFKCR